MANNIFNTILARKPKYSRFDLSHDHKLTTVMGRLTPIMCNETLPGDRWTISSEAMLRMMPMLAPIMHKVDVYTHYFFVPNRILWPNWEKFITGDPNDDELPPFPILCDPENPITVEVSSTSDYLGLPTGEIRTPVSALPNAAFARIWYEYYRDQNLQTLEPEERFTVIDGLQDNARVQSYMVNRLRAWEHDYFTSALPWAQKGDAINIPLQLGGTADVYYDPGAEFGPQRWETANTGEPPTAGAAVWLSGSDQLRDQAGAGMAMDPNGTYKVDGEDFDELQGTINDLRTAYALQTWLEKNARGGTRYVEFLLNHFGVRSSDQRLQRPEYLGGSKAPVVISEVLQMSDTTEESPQGTMAGHGISVGSGRTINYRTEEHGYIIGIMSVVPKTAYQQGIHRHFTKFHTLDYAFPDFAFLGEQAIKNQEIFYDPTPIFPDPNEQTFGYIPRYSEYRFQNSRISGQMRTSLNFWHLGRIFGSRPNLNAVFIQSNPSKRIFAVEDSNVDNLIVHNFCKISVARPLPKYGTPGGLM